MTTRQYEIGMVGLGVMGRNLLLNMADHGFSVAGYDKDPAQVHALRTEAGDRPVRGAESMEEFISLLRVPRAVMMLVPAGRPVDAVIRDLLPHLERGDLIIDGGNSYYKDTDLRAHTMEEKGIAYLGVGISGGEAGARHGPSMMPGGAAAAYERVRPILEDTAAQANGEPCVAYLGPGSAGHYVKMVHNGIEYGLMQLIAETYDIMKRGLGLDDDDLHEVYAAWNAEALNSYLLEITAHIFSTVDDSTGKRLVDVILDEARQKGTGMWTSQDAMSLALPAPTIDMAVAFRALSAFKEERESAAGVLEGPKSHLSGDWLDSIVRLRDALYTGMIITYAQGTAELKVASEAYGYGLDLERVARIWRGGCIIRSALLESIRTAFGRRSGLPNLLLDPYLAAQVNQSQGGLRATVSAAAEHGIPVPAMMASLAYLDGYRSAWLPANLIQAQRDYFGAHSYERIDAQGSFHTHWSEA